MTYEEIFLLFPPDIVSIIFATLLGLFLGLEREWSNKSAGVRTFSLISITGCVFGILNETLIVFGGLLIILGFTLILGIDGLLSGKSGLSLTTNISLLVAYGVGLLSGHQYYLEATTVAVVSSFLLVLKIELHTFALNLSKEEIRSATEFAILAFVIYPLLPSGNYGPWNAVNPQLVWLLVIAVSGIGFVNYVLVKQYNQQGIWVTGFFGGLVNSTAVIIALTDSLTAEAEMENITVGAILLANSAMAVRNAFLVILFVPTAAVDVGVPLGVMALTGLCSAAYLGLSSTESFDVDLESPFSMKNALTFGGFFLFLLILTAGANQIFGETGFIITSFIAGFVSSGSATTTAVTLVETGQVTPELASFGVLIGAVASIIVKVGIATSISRSLIKPIAIWNTLLIISSFISLIIIHSVLP